MAIPKVKPPTGFELEEDPQKSLPEGFELENKDPSESLPKGFEIETDPSSSLPPGFEYEDEGKQFGFDDQDIISKLHPIERSAMVAAARTGDIASTVPALVYAGGRFSVNKIADMFQKIHDRDFSFAKGEIGALPSEVIGPIEGKPLITKDIPKWLIDNPVRNQLKEAQQSFSYLNERYPNDDFVSLFTQGRYGEMTDWLLHQTIENAPYMIMTTAFALMGATPAMLASAGVYGASAKLGELEGSEEAKKLSTDEEFRISLMSGLAEAIPEVLGGKAIQYSSKLFKSIGVKAGGQVLESSLTKAIMGSAKAIGMNIAGEGLEELITEAVQGEIDMYYELEDGLTYKKVRRRMVNAAAIGSFSGGVISTPGAITKGIIDSSKVKKDIDVDIRPERQELTEIKATLEIQNKGYSDAQTEETIITPGPLDTEEVELAQVVDNALETKDYKDPGEENLDYLGNVIGGKVEREAQKDIFEEEIKEKAVTGEPVTPEQEEYRKYKGRQIEDVKVTPVEELNKLSDEDLLIWYEENEPKDLKSDENILASKKIHAALLAAGELESATNLREQIDSASDVAEATRTAMKEAEAKFVPEEKIVSKEERAQKRLQKLTGELEALEEARVGQIRPEEYRKKVEDIITEIQVLQEREKPAKRRKAPAVIKEKKGIRKSDIQRIAKEKKTKQADSAFEIAWNKTLKKPEREAFVKEADQAKIKKGFKQEWNGKKVDETLGKKIIRWIKKVVADIKKVLKSEAGFARIGKGDGRGKKKPAPKKKAIKPKPEEPPITKKAEKKVDPLRNVFERIKDIWFGKKDVRVFKTKTEKQNLQVKIREALGKKTYDEEVKKHDKAIQIYIDLKANPNHLEEYYNDLTKEQKQIADLSQNLPDNIKAIADDISSSYQEIGLEALENEVIRNVLDNYAGRVWDLEKGAGVQTHRKFGTRTRHAKQRTFETIVEGMAKGYKLKIEGATNNLQILKEEIIKTIEDKKFIQALKATKTIDGNPLISTKQLEGYSKIEHPNFRTWSWAGKAKPGEVYGKNTFVDEDGNLFEKRDLYAPKEQAENLNNILGISKLRDLPGIKTITKYNAIIKSWILQSSFFHHLAFLRSYMLGTNQKTWTEMNPRQAYKEGLRAIQEENEVVMLGVKNGLTLGLKQDWNEELIREKTEIGKFIDTIPGAKPFKDKILELRQRQADFLFGSFGAGLKAKSFAIEYRNLTRKHPEMSDNARAKIVANLINDDFGGLHLQRMGRNQTVQHIFRLFALAPDWTESNVRTMVKAFKKGPEGEVYRSFWAGILTKSAILVGIGNLLMAAFDEDDEETKGLVARFIRGFTRAWKEGRMLALDVDITPIYRMFGNESERRKYFSILGHFKDPIKFILHPVRSAHHKGSVIYKFFHEALTGVDWKGQSFTNWTDLLGIIDPRKTGKTVEWKFAGGGPLKYGQLPSFLLNQLKGSQPIQVQNFLAWISGEMEGFDAIAKSMGLRVSSTYEKKESKNKFYETAGFLEKRKYNRYKGVRKEVKDQASAIKANPAQFPIRLRSITSLKKTKINKIDSLIRKYNKSPSDFLMKPIVRQMDAFLKE